MTLLNTNLLRVHLTQCINWRKTANIQCLKLTWDRFIYSSGGHLSLKSFTLVYTTDLWLLKVTIYSVTHEASLRLNITWTVKKTLRLVTWLLIPGWVRKLKHCFLCIHNVFGGRPHKPSKFRNSPCARIAQILRRRLDLWILILRAQ